MRQIILSILGLALVLVAFMVAKNLIANKDIAAPTYEPIVPTVFIDTIHNGDIRVETKVSGILEAVNKIEIYSEVQGLFDQGGKFRSGARYRKGELMISIDRKKELATLKAQRSSLLNQIAGFLPDLNFDYPDQYEKWAKYISEFDIDKSTQMLPTADSDREKYFIATKNVSTTYYTIKNLEEQLAKYQIYAPFSGVLTENMVRPGALVSPGQRLGAFVGVGNFELELSVREEFSNLLNVGQELVVSMENTEDEIIGRLVRINSSLDPNSQSISAYVSLNGDRLKDGMFMAAKLPLSPINNAAEIDRKLLVSNQYVYSIENDHLVLTEVTPVYYNQETVVVQGLEDSSTILSRPLPGAREGLKIEILTH